MKRLYTFMVAIFSLQIAAVAQDRCATAEHMTLTMGMNPLYEKNQKSIEEFTQQFVSQQQQQGVVVVTIPVVVHVVYNIAAENVSDAQIFSQIDVLNEDFRKLNADWTNTPAAFQPLVADVNIEFCLASTDPNGNSTTGITRTSTAATSFIYTSDDVKHVATGGADAWPMGNYLNLWVCDLSGGILGYAQFPGVGPANEDGVVIDYQAFGTNGSAAAPFNLGRTGTHEVGHWLNLYHIWGDDGTSCAGSDLVADTPNQADENYNCPSFPAVSCSNGPNGDMFMNYMDYVDDACMVMFSNGQATRMQALFSPGGFRQSLLSSPGCQPSAGCYTFQMNDSFGDGWNGGVYNIYNAFGVLVASGTLDDGDIGTDVICPGEGCFTLEVTGGTFPGEISWTLIGVNGGDISGIAPSTTAFSAGNVVYGCTSSFSCNYNPSANCDDGSCAICFFSNCLNIEMTDSFGDGWNGGTYSIYNSDGNLVTSGTMDGPNESYDINAICLANGCYTMDISGGTFPGEIGWTLNGANEGTFSGGAPNSIGFTVGSVIYGCTDPFACNYNSSANCNDGTCVYCFNNCLSITMTDSFGDGWNGGVYLVNDIFGNQVYSGTMDSGDGSIDINAICLESGCYTMTITGGSFPGEIGWTLNGANEGVFSGGAPASISFSVGYTIPGCTEPFACNYNPSANCEDGTCVYCVAYCLSLTMTDSFGDNWNGAVYQIYDIDGALVNSGTMDSGNGSIDINAICLYDGCYTMYVTGGTFPSEVGWTLNGANEGPLSGVANTSVSFTVGYPVYGCTDPFACNYNPAATCESGCVYCLNYCLSFEMYDSFGDGWNGAGYTVYDTDGVIVMSGTLGYTSYGVDALCLDDGCYSLSVTGGSFPGEITWFLHGANEGTISGGASTTVLFTVGSPIYGCTEPFACNYNPNATCNDNTCAYCINYCLAITMTDSFGDGWNGGAYTIYDVHGNFVTSGNMDSGDGSVDVNAICLNSGCYTMSITGGTFPGEIGWTLSGANEGLFSGGAPISISFTVGTPVYGCTDSGASNYNPLATCDNGSCAASCAGDFDNNGVVNTGDLLLFMAQFGCNSSCGVFDLDGNTVVNTGDLLLFMAIFGTICP